jgi:hypothetical protein
VVLMWIHAGMSLRVSGPARCSRQQPPVPPPVPELLQGGNAGGAVTTDLYDTVGRWHLQDQVPIVGNSHELIQHRPVKDGVEGEVDLRDIKDDTLCAVVLRHPESRRERNATARDDGARTHSRERA